MPGLTRVNPYTHALEFNLPIFVYPGRGGNNLPVEFRYSSNVWRQDTAHTWRRLTDNGLEYTTDLNALYAEHSAAGWTSSLLPPRLEEDKPVYNANGNVYRDFVRGEGDNPLAAWWQWALWQMVPSSPPPGDSPSGSCDGIICTSMGYIPVLGFWLRACTSWSAARCTDTTYDEPDPTVVGDAPPRDLHYVPRLRVIMPDGSSHEFRKSDTPMFCGRMGPGQPPATPCNPIYQGTFLAVDGSGMTLDVDPEVTTLRMPNGSRYIFSGSAHSVGGNFADSFIDVNGNTMSFTESVESWGMDGKWTDTLGRQITDPIPHNWKTQAQQAGTPKAFNIPGLENSQQHYELTWKNLKPLGCEDRYVLELSGI